MCNVKVVFPEDSGPNISIILPFGTPPTPNATSSDKQPVGIMLSLILTWSSPMRIIAPLPN